MSFKELFLQYNWEKESFCEVSDTLVMHVLEKKERKTVKDLKILLSPAAASYLPQMMELSKRLTRQRFGNVIQMYIPLYLSNECQNVCTYCGFSFGNKIPRLTLNPEQILEEVKIIKSYGFDHVLLVTGEAKQVVGMPYFKEVLKLIRPFFSQISMEVQPLEENDYRELIELGLYGVLVYQETYNIRSYANYHPKGKKSNFLYRLETPDRLGKAGVHKIGLGTLLGLEDWRTDAYFLGLHLNYLEKKYWKTKYSISFPRLKPAEGVLSVPFTVTDKELIQLVCAFRIFNEQVELSLSTREPASLRDELVSLGVTSISSGSKTEPGGYALKNSALKQFEISDERTPDEVTEMLGSKGFEAIWKDWEAVW